MADSTNATLSIWKWTYKKPQFNVDVTTATSCQQVYDEENMAKQLLRFKCHHTQANMSIYAMS